MTEKEKMRRGLWYDANYDQELIEQRRLAAERCFLFNQTSPQDLARQAELLRLLLPNRAASGEILAPFYTDYGYNCFIGEHTFVNHNAYFMDGAPIRIGAYCFIGPNCGLYTANHPLGAAERNRGLEQALPITLGDNVWLGADVTVLPGVTIGNNAVIGAKSLVNRDIPANVLAVGNPCRVVREITPRELLGEGRNEK